ncbi:MAG TPA: ATP-binding protein [Terracidiphilus sp.]|nr:ATP-binding protein [Terracidiphilus sp.]
MKVFGTLYAKIFGWFWLTLTVGSLLIVLATEFTGTQPLRNRWMGTTQDMYAHSAIDFYSTGGKPALERYLQTLYKSSEIRANLLDSQGIDILGRQPSMDIARVLARSMRTGQPHFRLGYHWTSATPVQYDGRQYYFVMEVAPLRTFFAQRGILLPMGWRFMLALLVAGIFCIFLTRYIMTPVRALQSASLRLAAGDLSSRVLPAIAPRDDELADTARAFDQMADRIQSLVQKRQELLADISHELRSPLTRLSVSLELLRRGETDVVEQMQADLDRMNEMIGRILLLTRLDLQPLRADLAQVDLRALLEGIAADAEFEAQDDEKKVKVEALNGATVQGDADLLRSAFENIVRNAVHYTAPHTTVEIRAVSKDSPAGTRRCEVTVRDCGPGVPEASLPHLFDPFYRVSESRDLREGGTGLGLAITSKIVELHGGTVSAVNRTDRKGLEVRVVLPVTRQ